MAAVIKAGGRNDSNQDGKGIDKLGWIAHCYGYDEAGSALAAGCGSRDSPQSTADIIPGCNPSVHPSFATLGLNLSIRKLLLLLHAHRELLHPRALLLHL